MKFVRVIKNLILNFRNKYRVSFRNPHTGNEIWYIFLSPANIALAFMSLFLVMFISVMFLVTYSSVLDFVPGYPGSRSRDILIENVVRLDSLERKLNQWNTYRDNIAVIMDGKTPVSVTASAVASADSVVNVNKDIVKPNDVDSDLRKNIEAESKSQAKDKQKQVSEKGFEMYSPVDGVLVKQFNAGEGVDISVAGVEPVMAITDGVIILAEWTPNKGDVMQIQHGGGMISHYGNLSKIMKYDGERVKAGEVIGYAGGAPGEENQINGNSIILFKLWDNGILVDPENYVLLR